MTLSYRRLIAAALLGAVAAQPDAQCNTYVLPDDHYVNCRIVPPSRPGAFAPTLRLISCHRRRL